MSIAVNVEDLPTALAGYGYAYLLTVGDGPRAHVVAVTPVLRDGRLRVEAPGRRTLANAAQHPQVTFAFPPPDPGGYTLIVDGTAAGEDGALTVTPSSAVLHRPATPGAPPSATGCGSDCHHVDVQGG